MYLSTSLLTTAFLVTYATAQEWTRVAPPDPTITSGPSLNEARALIEIKDYSCPGVQFVDFGTSGCCVGGSKTIKLSTCPGWPICDGPATASYENVPLSCATVLDPDDSDYTSKAQSAEDSMKASGTVYKTVVGGGEITGGGVTATGKPEGGDESKDAALPMATGRAGMAGLVVLFGVAAFL